VWILDTDHLTLFLQGHLWVMERFATRPVGEVVISIVTAEEQLWGRLSAIRKASQATERVRLLRAYHKLHQTVDDLIQFEILDFTETADLAYQTFRQQKIRIGTQDLRIASIALSVGGIVVTRNRRDFEQVPGLAIEDWSIAR
jgi:tRNA(fMet)-specific endonuclease VapC